MAVRVLIVDDQAQFRDAARMVVEATPGFEVAGEVDTGEASVEAAASIAPDLVLMDLNLPGINGLEATRRIVAASVGVTVIVCSTYDPADYAAQAEAAGASGYLAKSELGPDTLTAAWEAADRR